MTTARTDPIWVAPSAGESAHVASTATAEPKGPPLCGLPRLSGRAAKSGAVLVTAGAAAQSAQAGPCQRRGCRGGGRDDGT